MNDIEAYKARIRARALMIAMQIVSEELERQGVCVDCVQIDALQKAGEELLVKTPEIYDMARDQLRRMQ